MYVVAIAWLYVALMIAITEPSFIGGVLSLTFYGLLPSMLFLWLFGKLQRKRNRSSQIAEENTGQPDRADSKTD